MNACEKLQSKDFINYENYSVSLMMINFLVTETNSCPVNVRLPERSNTLGRRRLADDVPQTNGDNRHQSPSNRYIARIAAARYSGRYIAIH